MVAVEMARRLIALGKRVECVLILDGGLPNSDTKFDPLDFIEVFAKNIGVPEVPRSESIEDDIEDVLRRIAKAVGTRQESVVDDPLASARATIVAAENNHRRMKQWQVRPVDVPIIVLRASDNTSRATDLGWSNALGRPVQVLFVPGEHHSMMQPPFVQTLAFCIEGLLTQHDGHAKQL
jgi:thioesterase domain-containing protein